MLAVGNEDDEVEGLVHRGERLLERRVVVRRDDERIPLAAALAKHRGKAARGTVDRPGLETRPYQDLSQLAIEVDVALGQEDVLRDSREVAGLGVQVEVAEPRWPAGLVAVGQPPTAFRPWVVPIAGVRRGPRMGTSVPLVRWRATFS